MKHTLLRQHLLLTCLFLLALSCNNKQPYKPDYKDLGGYVIGKETCQADETQDYWLLDFTVFPNQPQLGDTLTLNGRTYTNVLKVKGLDNRLKHIGMRVGIDYMTVTPNKIATSGCTVASPVTYFLKEIFIIHQFEIR